MRLVGSRAYTRPVHVPKMPVGLVELMEGLTRDVLKNNPPDIYEFCANHMHTLLEIRDGPTKKVTLSLEEKIVRAQKKVKQKSEARYQKYLEEVKNTNSKGEKSNIETDIHPDLHKKSTAPLTSPLQHMLKPPVHQDLNLSNASEIEISHGSGVVISSASSNVHNKTEATDDIKPEHIIEERVSKIDYADMEKGSTSNSSDIKVESDDSLLLSENTDILKPKTENGDVYIDEDKVASTTLLDEPSTNVAHIDNSTDSKVINNDNKQSCEDYKEKEIVESDLIFHDESSENEIESSLLHEDIDKKTKTYIMANNEEELTIINQSNIQNLNDDQNEAEKIVTNLNEYENKTNSHELGSSGIEETNFKEIDKIVTETTMEGNNEMVSSVIIEKDNEILKHDKMGGLERNVIADDSKENLHQDHIDGTIVQTNIDKSDDTNMSDKIGEIKLVQNEVKENDSISSINDLKNGNLPKETINSEVIILDNKFLNEKEKNTSIKEISPLKNTVDNVNYCESEINTAELNTDQFNKGTEVCKVSENTSEVIKTFEQEESRIVNTSGNQPIKTSRDTSNEQLELSQNVQLLSNCDMFSEKSVAKNYENEQLNDENESMIQTLKNEINLNTEDNVQLGHELTSQIEKNVLNLNIENNEQHGVEHESKSHIEKNVLNCNIEDNAHNRVERDVTEPVYNHNDETVFSKKSISGDESTDGNDNTSFIESSTSEIPDDTSQRTNPSCNAMDLETAAVTIQKVFRTFLFKSRASTFDDTNDENMPLDDDNDKKEEIEFQASNVNVGKERRGISRMDTVLQTVNEEKSLSLSTDDSSTLSSAATTIQAHVRGFLVRNKLHSNKTASTSSLVNSDGPSSTSLEGDAELNKNKTILNIHIVPEGGNYLSREESMLTSMDLSLDGSPPSSLNLHPLGYDRNERRKQLKREDAIQSISPPSNNSGKLSEDVDSVKDLLITDEVTSNQKKSNFNSLQPESGDTSPTNSTTIETVVEAHKTVDVESPDPKLVVQVNGTKRSITKMSSDEMDVVTPFEDSPENESSTGSGNASKLMHSGEFHDIVLPTKVSRKDTSVVSEFKNVLVYFLLWNNS